MRGAYMNNSTLNTAMADDQLRGGSGVKRHRKYLGGLFDEGTS